MTWIAGLRQIADLLEAAMEPGLSDQDDSSTVQSILGICAPQWSLVFPTRMTLYSTARTLAAMREPQWSLVFPTRMTKATIFGSGVPPSCRNGAWSFRPG